MPRPILAFCLFLLLPWIPAGCGSMSIDGSSSGSPLVGTWETESGTAGMQFRYIFKSDGSMQSAAIMGGMTNPQSGTWRVVDSTRDDWTVEFVINTGRRGSTATEEMHIQFRDNDHITMVPAGAGALADQLSRKLARVSY